MDAAGRKKNHHDQHKKKHHEKQEETHVEDHGEQHASTLHDVVLLKLNRPCEEPERVKEVLEEILTRKRTFKDEQDDSVHPSYTKFKVPYHITCWLRYSKKSEDMEEQFKYEINQMVRQQATAYDAARFTRYMSVTTLWPLLHNRKQIEYFQKNFFRLKRKQKKRLEFLMSTELN